MILCGVLRLLYVLLCSSTTFLLKTLIYIYFNSCLWMKLRNVFGKAFYLDFVLDQSLDIWYNYVQTLWATALQNIPFATKPFTNPIVQGFYEYLHQMTHLKWMIRCRHLKAAQ